MRWEETAARSGRRLYERCIPKKAHYLHPIIDWTTEEVWYYIRSRNLEYCKLYDAGRTRLGCLFCPLSGIETRRLDVERYPKYVKRFISMFDRFLEARRELGRPYGKFKDGEELFYWWVFYNKREQDLEAKKNEELPLFS